MTGLDLLAGILEAAAACVLLEALCRWYRRYKRRLPSKVAERAHVTYDAEIGWVGIPGLALDDFYGPGRSLHTDKWGFRGKRSADPEVRARPLRIMCSGDSYTLGYGVDDEECWVRLMSGMDHRIETINMGMGGYGIQQAFLLFMSKGTKFVHDVHIFSVLSNDFTRMRTMDFFGYPRPIVQVSGGRLCLGKAGPGSGIIWALEDLAGWLAGRKSPGAGARPVLTDEEILEASFAILEACHAYHRERDSIFVTVFMPVLPDELNGISERWRDPLKKYAAERGIPFIDLVPEMMALPREEAWKMYIRKGEIGFLYADGHLNARGNRFVAERILDRLYRLPEFARKISRADR